MTFYGDCVKMCKDFAPNFGNKRTGCSITTMHRLTLPFPLGNLLTKDNVTVGPHPPIFLFPQTKIELKCRHIDTIEAIEAELQEVLKTLTEPDFQDAFREWQKCWERCIRAEVFD
jgi:hypothetical protein